MAIDKKKLDAMFGTTSSNIPAVKNTTYADDSFDMSDLDEDDESLPSAPVVYTKDATLATQPDICSDIEYSRKTLQSLINRGQQLVEIAVEQASTGAARDIEVASGTISATADLAGKLLDIHKKTKDIFTTANNGAPAVHIENQTVYATTADIMKNLDEEDIEEADYVE